MIKELIEWARNIREGIKNVYRWFPIIWQDRDYDYYYLMAIMSTKINFMANFFESDRAYTLNAKLRAERMRLVIKLIENMQEEMYINQSLDELEEIKHPTEPIIKQIEKEGEGMQDKNDNLIWKIMNHEIKNWWD